MASRSSSSLGGARRSANPPVRVCLDQEPLGTGTFGRVYRGYNHACEPVAVKLIRMSKLGPADLAAARCETAMLRRVGAHPNLLPLLDCGENDKHIFSVSPIIAGGDLQRQLRGSGVHYSDAEARELLRKLLSGIAHMHERGVMHRDIKTENILLRPAANGGVPTDPVLIDFGAATDERCSATFAGTMHFAAPEVLEASQDGSTTIYDNKCDVWSFGVVAYMVLQAGTRPFSGRHEQECAMEICLNKPPWDEPCSIGARKFVSHLLRTNPSQRPTAAEALQHPWLTGATEPETSISQKLQALRLNAEDIDNDPIDASAISASNMSDLLAMVPSSGRAMAQALLTPARLTPAKLGPGGRHGAAGCGPVSPSVGLRALLVEDPSGMSSLQSSNGPRA